MVYNKIYAQLGEERHIVLDPINYQYDIKQILVIQGETVPEYYEADICNVGDTATLTMVGTAADGVEIPDKFLLDGRNVLVYVVIPGSGGDVQTRYDITIPVDERAEREDIDPSEAEQQQIDSLIAALNSGVGRAEAAVTHYPKIMDGYWTVWNAETETWVNTGIRAEGRDGYSPEVTITEIEGGHRVTITDEDHPQGQTFDVMDGQGGSTGDYDELTNRPRINGHTLTGNQSASDLELGTYSKPSSGIPKTDLAQDVQQSLQKANTALQTAPVQSVANKTGAVNLNAGDVGFNSSEEYNEGTVGAELSELNRQLSDKQDAPATAGTAGQVLSLDDQLNPVWSTPSGGGGDVTDVQIDGTSILSDGVANIPIIQPNKYGMAKLGYGQGVFATLNGGVLYLDKASNDEIKNGVHDRRAIVPVNQHAAAFFGLAKAAGDTTQAQSSNPVGTYTDEAKAAIKSMLGVADGGGMNIVNLSGTQITQVGVNNTMYMCGELAELTFTAPSVGITGIRFTSGTTPTVLTISGVTSWMFDFDPTALEASKTYEINVLNGVGCAGW